jgi:hypothetical protein
MRKVKVKLRELRNADVRYISIVDKAASRIAFRVLKSDEEKNMAGIDLSNLLSRKSEKVAPRVCEVIVLKQETEEVTTAVQHSIADAGFKTNTATKSEEEIVRYHQVDPNGEAVLVRLSDNLMVSVDGLPQPTGFMAHVVEELGYYPNRLSTMVAVNNQIEEMVAKGEATPEKVKAVMDSAAEYLHGHYQIPAAAFKADMAVSDLAAAGMKQAESMEHVCKGCGGKKVKKGDSYMCEKCDAMKEDETTEKTVEKVVEEPVKEETEVKTEEAVKADEAVEKVEEKKEVVEKNDNSDILAALSTFQTTVMGSIQSLSTKVDGVVKQQETDRAAIDAVAKKAETLNNKLASTVLSDPPPPDRIPGSEPVKKKDTEDDDPRKGVFDTAFIGRRKR